MSSDYKIKVEEACVFELRKQAEAKGITVNTLMSQIVEGVVTQPSIDIAAEVFLSYLEPEHRKFIIDMAADSHRSPAAYIMSYITLAHDRGETAIAVPEALDPTTQSPLAATASAPVKESTCEWCQRPFTPQQEGQRYCPTPIEGESCGRQASLAAIRSARNKTVDRSIPAPHIVEHTVRM